MTNYIQSILINSEQYEHGSKEFIHKGEVNSRFGFIGLVHVM